MAQRRHHYESAFESYLRAGRIPYVAVDEARKSLIPATGSALPWPETGNTSESLKSFDFVLYGHGTNLLAEVKGRKLAVAHTRHSVHRRRSVRLESWVTREDVESLGRWESLFGPAFEAAFIFVYWCEAQPPDALFHEVFEHRGRWYTIRAVYLREYRAAMKTRSVSWGTVDIPSERFTVISAPLTGAVGALELPVFDKL